MDFSEALRAYERDHPYQTREVNGCTFRYCLCGNETARHTLVYLVGGSGNPSGWFRHVLAMEQEYRVLLCDYPVGVETMEGMAHLIAALTDSLQISKAVWIGASMGGYAAQLLTKFYPERTDAQVLYATSCLSEQGIAALRQQYRGMGVLWWAMNHLPYPLLKALLIKPTLRRLMPAHCSPEEKAYLEGFIQWTYDGYTRESDLHITRLQMSLAATTPVTADDFAYIGRRTLLILPENDKAFPVEMQQDLIRTMAGASVETLDGGHLATLTCAEEYARRTADFLHRLDRL